MLARLQQIVTLAIAAAVGGWAAASMVFHLPLGAAGGAILIFSGYALALGMEMLIQSRVNRHDTVPAATLGDLVVAWCGELWTAPRVFCWRQPFRSQREPDTPHLARDGVRTVVFVHGYVCNRGLWTPWLRRLRARNIPFFAINLEPVFGSIDEYVGLIESTVRRVEQATRRPPVVVAHSMGGMAVRAWLAATGTDDRVHRIITIGTPHRGTWLARFSVSENARQMRLRSPWCEALAARESIDRYRRFICFYSHCDNVVFPASSATLPGADNRHLKGVAHVQMAHSEEIFAEILRNVQS